MIKLLSGLWKVLDGNKTIVGTALLGFVGNDGMKDVLDPNLVDLIYQALLVFTGGAGAHHIVKGHLKKDRP